jgi:transposase
VPLLMTAPGIAWVLAFTIAAEIGDITRFSSPRKLCGYTGLCPRVNQSGDKDRRGPLTKQGPALPALGDARSDHARAAASRLRRALPADQGPARQAAGREVAQIDVARRLTEAVSHMLTFNQPFAPAAGGATLRLAA